MIGSDEANKLLFWISLILPASHGWEFSRQARDQQVTDPQDLSVYNTRMPVIGKLHLRGIKACNEVLACDKICFILTSPVLSSTGFGA